MARSKRIRNRRNHTKRGGMDRDKKMTPGQKYTIVGPKTIFRGEYQGSVNPTDDPDNEQMQFKNAVNVQTGLESGVHTLPKNFIQYAMNEDVLDPLHGFVLVGFRNGYGLSHGTPVFAHKLSTNTYQDIILQLTPSPDGRIGAYRNVLDSTFILDSLKFFPNIKEIHVTNNSLTFMHGNAIIRRGTSSWKQEQLEELKQICDKYNVTLKHNETVI